MAFQKGSQIRPELMRGDMSGFAQAAQFKAQEGQMWGQALNNLGEQIGGVIKQKREKEEKVAKDKAAVNILVAQGIPTADAQAAVKSGMSDTILSMSQQDKKMKAQAQQQAAALAVQQQMAGQGQQRVDIAQAAADQKAMNVSAQKTAIDASTDTSGNVDWKQATSIYSQVGGSDIKGFSEAAEAAKEATSGKDEFTTETIGAFDVLLKNGKYVIGKGTGIDDKTPSSVKTAKATIEAIGKAREYYSEGTAEGRAKAKDILQSWDVMDTVGLPADVDEYFGGDSKKDSLGIL